MRRKLAGNDKEMQGRIAVVNIVTSVPVLLCQDVQLEFGI